MDVGCFNIYILYFFSCYFLPTFDYASYVLSPAMSQENQCTEKPCVVMYMWQIKHLCRGQTTQFQPDYSLIRQSYGVGSFRNNRARQSIMCDIVKDTTWMPDDTSQLPKRKTSILDILLSSTASPVTAVTLTNRSTDRYKHTWWSDEWSCWYCKTELWNELWQLHPCLFDISSDWGCCRLYSQPPDHFPDLLRSSALPPGRPPDWGSLLGLCPEFLPRTSGTSGIHPLRGGVIVCFYRPRVFVVPLCVVPSVL